MRHPITYGSHYNHSPPLPFHHVNASTSGAVYPPFSVCSAPPSHCGYSVIGAPFTPYSHSPSPYSFGVPSSNFPTTSYGSHCYMGFPPSTSGLPAYSWSGMSSGPGKKMRQSSGMKKKSGSEKKTMSTSGKKKKSGSGRKNKCDSGVKTKSGSGKMTKSRLESNTRGRSGKKSEFRKTKSCS